MQQWMEAILRYLAEARDSGDVTTAVDDQSLAGQLLNMLLGAQVAAALVPDGQTELGLGGQLEGFLALLAR
jgi:hypothetical protein